VLYTAGQTLVTSCETIEEILTVFASQFSNDAEALCRAVANLVGLSKLVRSTGKLKALETKMTTKSLNVGAGRDTAFIITGDKAILMLKRYPGTRIITLREFLNIET